jgi:hypothetical protein
MTDQSIPRGFILSDAAYYAFQDQDVYPDILSFCSAIPSHLRPLFVIPVSVEMEPGAGQIASRVASARIADGAIPTGQTEEESWFGTRTFTYPDNEPTVPQTDPGSIFDIDGADAMTHHQEYMFDENIQNPTDTSYPTDVDMTQYWQYPYRTQEKPVRHSSVTPFVAIVRLALKSDELETHTPAKVRNKAEICNVKFISFDKRNRVYTFSVGCGKKSPHIVKASISDLNHVAITCDCPFWQWNGPEYHAKKNGYLLGEPRGTASPPDIRDPERKYWLCKHTYAVTTRLDSFVKEIAEENAELNEKEILEKVDDNWDKLEGVAQIPLEEAEDADDIEVEWEEIEEPEEVEELEAEAAEGEEAETEVEDTPDIEWEEITDEDIDWGTESAESEDEEEHWKEHAEEDITDEDINWEEKPAEELETKEEPEPEPEPEDITDEDIDWEESEEEKKK